MCKAIRASVLVLLLAGSAQAGWIQNEAAPTPPPPPPTITQEEPTAEGVMPNGGPESLTETVLSLLGSVLALL